MIEKEVVKPNYVEDNNLNSVYIDTIKATRDGSGNCLLQCFQPSGNEDHFEKIRFVISENCMKGLCDLVSNGLFKEDLRGGDDE